MQVVAPSDAGEVGPPTLDGIPVRRVRYAQPAAETLAYRGTMAEVARIAGGAWRALCGLWRALRRAARAGAGRGAELVHAHWWVPGGLAAPPGAPLVLTVHGTDARAAAALGAGAHGWRGRCSGARGWSRPCLLASAARSPGRTGRVIGRHPRPADAGRGERYRPGRPAGHGLVVVARLTPQKRVDLALRGAGLSAGLDVRLPLTIVGDGPERAALEALRRGISACQRE